MQQTINKIHTYLDYSQVRLMRLLKIAFVVSAVVCVLITSLQIATQQTANTHVQAQYHNQAIQESLRTITSIINDEIGKNSILEHQSDLAQHTLLDTKDNSFLLDSLLTITSGTEQHFSKLKELVTHSTLAESNFREMVVLIQTHKQLHDFEENRSKVASASSVSSNSLMGFYSELLEHINVANTTLDFMSEYEKEEYSTSTSHWSVVYKALLLCECMSLIVLIVYGRKLHKLFLRSAMLRYEQSKALHHSFEHNQSLIKTITHKEQSIRKLTNAIPGVIFQYRWDRRTHGESGYFTFISQSSKDILGIESNDITADGTIFKRLISEYHIARFNDTLAVSVQSMDLFDCEFEYNHPTLGMLWIRGVAQPELASDGAIVWYGIFSDITVQKQSEKMVRQNEYTLRSITDAIPGVVFQLLINPDESREYKFLSSGTYELLGFTAEDIRTDPYIITNRINLEDTANIANTSYMAIQNKEGCIVEFRYTHPEENREIWICETAIPEYLSDGSILWNGILTDVTKRKHAEISLQESIADLQKRDSMLETSSEVLRLVVTDSEDFDSAVKKAMQKLSDTVDVDRMFLFQTDYISQEQEIFCTLAHWWCNDSFEVDLSEHESFAPIDLGFTQLSKQVLNDQVYYSSILDMEVKARRILRLWKVRGCVAVPIYLRNTLWGVLTLHDCKYTRRNWKESELNVLRGAAASLAGAIERHRAEITLKQSASYLINVKNHLEEKAHELEISNTSLQIARTQAESANRAKSIFLSSMSHEFRTPLNAILGFTQILRKDSNLNDAQMRHIDTMYRSGQHLLGMINDVLDISKIEAGHLELTPEITSIYTLADDLRGMFHLRCLEKNISYSIVIDSTIPNTLVVDAMRLRQILINLIGNAIKFTPENKSIRVSITNENQWCDIATGKTQLQLACSVVDTGRGIPSEQLATIFEPFRQVNGMYSEGTGLGLAICSRIVNLMGGEMVVDSQLGHGSEFRFTIKTCLADEGQEAVTMVSSTPVARIESEKIISILIVDDIESNRDVLRGMLEPFGIFSLAESANGKDAIEYLQNNTPDLILLDLLMPIMSGEETIRHIRNDNRLSELCVVAVTASGFDGKREELLHSGFNDYLRKPFDENDLYAILERYTAAQLIRAHQESAYLQPPQAWNDSLSAQQILFNILQLGPQISQSILHSIDVQDFEKIIEIVTSIEAEQPETQVVLSELHQAALKNNFKLFVQIAQIAETSGL